MARREAAWTVLVAILFALLWPRLHPPLPHPAGSDLYGHLTVARHLARGEGFRIDTVYPVSLAFPFARALPQPLIQRRPGYPLLLVGPHVAAGGEPARTLRLVYRLQVGLVAILAALALGGAVARGAAGAGLACLVLLAGSPLAGMSVAWGRVEVMVAVLLLAIWLGLRAGPDARRDDGRPPHPEAGPAGPRRAVLLGVAAGVLALVRLDLFWIPWLWWLASHRRPAWRGTALFAVAWLLVLVPWMIRDWRLTGRPVFSLQAYAEHLKETRAWPGYRIYRSLSPEALTATLARDPAGLWTKFRGGIAFFLRGLGGWLPWTAWAAAALLAAAEVRTRGLHAWRRPLPLALVTTGLLIGEYALFSHTVRHLLVVLPVLALEIGLAAAARLRLPARTPGAVRRLALPVLAGAALLLSPPRLDGWQQTLATARAEAPAVVAAVAAARAAPPGPLFADCAAVAWYADRVTVWTPLDPEVEAAVRGLVPALAGAPVIRLEPVAGDGE
jgi:hypothetical protein